MHTCNSSDIVKDVPHDVLLQKISLHRGGGRRARVEKEEEDKELHTFMTHMALLEMPVSGCTCLSTL